MTLPLWLLIVLSAVVAGALWLAYTEGRTRGKRIKQEGDATLRSRAYREGFDEGHRCGATDQRRDSLSAAKAVLDRFPTSLGARAMFRALGGNPGPRPRRRTTAPVVIESDGVARTVTGFLPAAPDHGEGEE